MTFIHEDPEWRDLLTIVANSEGIDRALVEKDYWAIHALWSLSRTDLEIWFKGGTSLSKGFGLIQRFSEDLDLRVEPGETSLPIVQSWTSMNRGPVAQRKTFYEALTEIIDIPGAGIIPEPESLDRKARGARYRVEYPGLFLNDLGPMVRPFVLLEVGTARVTPHVERCLRSFVHSWLETRDQASEFIDNRPNIRCVHPLVTLIEKLDAISRRFGREPMEPAAFVRHYSDAARIIADRKELPSLEIEIDELVRDMLEQKQIRRAPKEGDPAWSLSDPTSRQALEGAHRAIAPMFWSDPGSIVEACQIIRAWLRQSLRK